MKYWTGVGSRVVPWQLHDSFGEIGYWAAKAGYTLRSGYADGSDIMFQRAVCLVDPKLTQIWVPWKGFSAEQKIKGCKEFIISEKSFPIARDFLLDNKIISDRHWANMSQGARKLHARNFYQIVGRDLEPLSEFCVYYAKHSKSGEPQGGTRTAVLLAKYFSVQTYRIDVRSDFLRLRRNLSNEAYKLSHLQV